MSRFCFSRHTRWAALLITTIALVATAVNIYAAYQTTRPIVEGTWGYINQGYLYGEGPDVHKGVDFPAALDTDVIAVADGVVREVNEEGADGCRQGQMNCGAFGNFILVRHTRQHYDRTVGQMAYVYSLYAHLSWHGAFVNPEDNVVAGQVIGDVDNTGNSTNNHVHLQIMIDTDPNRTVDFGWTEVESRNPELWLRPYSGNTGTAVGKVTNTNGDPVGDRLVCGLQKQAGWGYGWNVTYNHSSLNPDDILVENFGTTDVTPGTYAIHTCPNTTAYCGCSNPISMGTHTVEAGRITYVGLYPVWLPYVRNNSNEASPQTDELYGLLGGRH